MISIEIPFKIKLFLPMSKKDDLKLLKLTFHMKATKTIKKF
jgi:hypothetical protein